MWISVKDRLPETNLGSAYNYSEVVAVLTKDVGYPTTARLERYGGRWYCLLSDDSPEVTHWMPLPEIPKRK